MQAGDKVRVHELAWVHPRVTSLVFGQVGILSRFDVETDRWVVNFGAYGWDHLFAEEELVLVEEAD